MRLINADALKETITNNPLIDFTDDDIFELIDNAPSVKPCENCDLYFKAMTKEAQKGNWIVKTKSTFPQYQPDEYVCPFCNTIVNFKTKFCPDCGASLKGGTE